MAPPRPTSAAVRRALRNHRLHAWFQPLVSLQDRSVVGFEALTRWVQPDGTVTRATELIPVAERSTLIVALDDYILRESLAALTLIAPYQHVAVNVSPVSLADPQLTYRVLTALKETHTAAHRLHLEVTETSLLRVTADVRATVETLASLGVTWWADDFGTGYSSLTHLLDLPVQGLKLDRSFVSRISDPDPRARNLVHGILELANRAGLSTLAEGVETEAQAQLLAEQGWQTGQGWLFGKPTPVDQVREHVPL